MAAFLDGADCWHAILDPDPADQDRPKKLYAVALMLAQLCEAVTSEPKRSVDIARATLKALGTETE